MLGQGESKMDDTGIREYGNTQISPEDAINTGKQTQRNVNDIKAIELRDRAYELLAMLPKDTQDKITNEARKTTKMETSDDSYHHIIVLLTEAELGLSQKTDTKSLENTQTESIYDFKKQYASLSPDQQKVLTNLATTLLQKSHETYNEENLQFAMSEILTSENPSNAAKRARDVFFKYGMED